MLSTMPGIQQVLHEMTVVILQWLRAMALKSNLGLNLPSPPVRYATLGRFLDSAPSFLFPK